MTIRRFQCDGAAPSRRHEHGRALQNDRIQSAQHEGHLGGRRIRKRDGKLHEERYRTLNSFMGAFSLIMGAVAGLSLLVGGIGIMNMMLTNVTKAHPRNWHSPRPGCKPTRHHGPVFGRIIGAVHHRRHFRCRDWLSAGLGAHLLCRKLGHHERVSGHRVNYAELFHYDRTDRVCRIGRHRRDLWLLPAPPRRKARSSRVPALQ